MASSNILINGKEYSYSDVRVHFLGRTVEGISAVSYEDNVEKKNNIGRGNMPVSRTRGNYEAKSSITLSMKEVVAIQAALQPGQRLQDIAPFDIEVSYVDDNGTNRIVNDRIRNCEFTNNKRELKTGGDQFDTQFDLITGSIDWNVA